MPRNLAGHMDRAILDHTVTVDTRISAGFSGKPLSFGAFHLMTWALSDVYLEEYNLNEYVLVIVPSFS